MAEDPPDDVSVPVVCEDCDTTTRVPLPDVQAVIDRHNDTVHGGDAVAQIDPVLRSEIADLAADDLTDIE